MTRPLAYLAALLMSAGLGGCASSNVSKWPALDESRLSFAFVAGDFTGVRKLNAVPCNLTPEEMGSNDLIVDCFSGPPSTSTLNVYDVVHGDVRDRQLRVAYHPSIGRHHEPPGDGEPVLVLLRTDGKHFELTYEQKEIALTTGGEWAMPVYADAQLYFLPCGARPLIKRLRFVQPLPSVSLEEYDEAGIESFRKNPHGEIRNGRFFPRDGILLRDMKKFLAAHTSWPKDSYCRDYESPAAAAR